jgi:hypothetical protein
MSPTGGSDEILVLARAALLDALIALHEHRESVVVIGAQAVYLHTGSALVAVAEATKDSDVGIDLGTLGDDPLIEEAMHRAGFYQDLVGGQPGAWLSPIGIPVDLMVPDASAGSGRRSVQALPHDKRALRRAVGLEAAVVDNAAMMIGALAADDEGGPGAPSQDPHLPVQGTVLRAGQIVADPLRNHDRGSRGEQAEPGRVVGECSVECRPSRVSQGLVGELRPKRRAEEVVRRGIAVCTGPG